MKKLVLIPGLGSDAAVWSRTISALGDDALCIVGDTLQDGSLTSMARRILAAAPAAFTLAGLSMGGMVALEIMRLEPARVTALAIVDSNAFPDTPEQAEQRRRMLAAVRGGIDIGVYGQSGLARLIHPDAANEVGDEILAMGVRVGAETYARQIEAVLHRPDQRPVLTAIAIPTLVVTGADDAMIPPSCAEAMAAAISGAKLVVVPNCGHLPPIEQPRATATLLRGLSGRPG